MSDTPEELYYASTHEWLRMDADGTAVVGITDFAQDELGDVVFVELPAVGKQVKAGGDISVVESVKTASDLYSPISGEVVAINEALSERPEIINESPYGEGWIFRLKVADPSEVESLLSAEAYRNECA